MQMSRTLTKMKQDNKKHEKSDRYVVLFESHHTYDRHTLPLYLHTHTDCILPQVTTATRVTAVSNHHRIVTSS